MGLRETMKTGGETQEVRLRFYEAPEDIRNYDLDNWDVTFRAELADLAQRLDMAVTDSREKSLALTALEEAGMWIQKALRV